MYCRLEGKAEIEIDTRNYMKLCMLYFLFSLELLSKKCRAKFIKYFVNLFRKI